MIGLRILTGLQPVEFEMHRATPVSNQNRSDCKLATHGELGEEFLSTASDDSWLTLLQIKTRPRVDIYISREHLRSHRKENFENIFVG